MKLQTFLTEAEIISEEMLREALNYREDSKFGAFWLISDEPILALFINNNYACLYYMPSSGNDKWSKNSDFSGNEEDTIDFLIENYQQDDISAEVVISTDRAIEAFIHYYKTSELSSHIGWF